MIPGERVTIVLRRALQTTSKEAATGGIAAALLTLGLAALLCVCIASCSVRRAKPEPDANQFVPLDEEVADALPVGLPSASPAAPPAAAVSQTRADPKELVEPPMGLPPMPAKGNTITGCIQMGLNPRLARMICYSHVRAPPRGTDPSLSAGRLNLAKASSVDPPAGWPPTHEARRAANVIMSINMMKPPPPPRKAHTPPSSEPTGDDL